jgi:site-specific DNA-adenine methylase
VGYLQLGGLRLEVLPKLDRVGTGDWRALLVHMLREVLGLRIAVHSAASLRSRHGTLYDVLVERFLVLVAALLREGLSRGYRELEGNEPCLRGRLVIDRHVRMNAGHQERLYVAYSTFDADNLPNRILLRALEFVLATTSSASQRSTQGIEAKTAARIEAFAPRLKNVRIYGGDYGKVVAKYDSPNTVFFFDPPYPGYNVDVGESDFDEDRFFGVLKSLKGKFLLTYGVRGKLPGLLKDAGFAIKRIRTPRSIGSMRGVGGPSVLTQLVVANFDLVEKTEDGVEPLLEDWHGQLELGDAAGPEAEVEKAQAFGTFGGSHHYAKRLLPRIPEHTTYVEPFAGAAALLYAKEPSAKEVIADNDADVVFLHRAVKAMTPERVAELARRFEWKCTEESFAKARDMAPKDDVERFYKLVFVRTHARDCRPDGTHPARNHLGSTTNPEKYLRAAERLKGVSILQQD